MDVLPDLEDSLAWDHQDGWPGAAFPVPRVGADSEGGNALHMEPPPVPASCPTEEVEEEDEEYVSDEAEEETGPAEQEVEKKPEPPARPPPPSLSPPEDARPTAAARVKERRERVKEDLQKEAQRATRQMSLRSSFGGLARTPPTKVSQTNILYPSKT